MASFATSGFSTSAFSILAFDLGEFVEAAVTIQPSGGYGFGAYDRRRRKEEEELADEIARLEVHLGVQPENVSDIPRIKALVEDFRRQSEANLTNKARRAFDYAERARTEQAWMLAFREFQKAQEQDELNLILSIALDD